MSYIEKKSGYSLNINPKDMQQNLSTCEKIVIDRKNPLNSGGEI